MGRRARSSVVVLSRRRKQKGGSEEVLQSFKQEDMVWSRLSAIFFERLSSGKIKYEIQCDSGSLNIDEGKACKTNIPALKLRLDDSTETLTFFLTMSGKALLEWKLNRGILTLREDFLRSPDYYKESSVPNKIKKLLQWAIESIDQYYPNKETIAPLTKCVLLNENKKEEKPMTEFLNDDLRARYRCDEGKKEVCDVSFGAFSVKKSPMSIVGTSPSLRSAPRSASQLTISFLPTPTPSNKKSSGIRILSPAKPSAIPLAKPPSAMQAKPPSAPRTTRKASARTVEPSQEQIKVAKFQWLRRLFRRPVEL